jgi:hypothetical protein
MPDDPEVSLSKSKGLQRSELFSPTCLSASRWLAQRLK